MQISKQAISKFFFIIATALLSFIFYNVFISSVLFIFKININPSYAIIALILSIVTMMCIYPSKPMFIKNKLIERLLTVLLFILVIVSSIYLNGQFYDHTWDGNSYHKSTIGLMKDGWNPLYEDMEEYDSSQEMPLNIKSNSYDWGNHYAKVSHIFAANIYSITGNIECGKSINTLSIIILFCYILSFLLNLKKKTIFSILFSIVVVTYPVVCAQYLTNYVDLLVYIYLILTILMFFFFEKPVFNQKSNLFVYFMILNIVINIKFSSFGFAGIFCLGYFGWYIYRLLKNKIDKSFFKKFTIVSALGVISGVFLIGLSVYPKNLLEHGNPFYPLLGEGKIEIMIQNQPAYFENKTPIEKFIISTFSKAENIAQSSGLEATYKLPFTIYNTELENLSSVDLRISGNGVLFSGILIISLLILLSTSIFVFKKNKKAFIMLIIPVLITIAMIFLSNESWWARYFPQIYFIILASIAFLEILDKKLLKIIMYAFIIVILINNGLTLSYSTKYSYDESKLYASQFYNFEKQYNADTCNLELYTQSFHGAYYNIIDRYKDYQISFATDEEYNNSSNSFQTFMNSFVVWHCKE